MEQRKKHKKIYLIAGVVLAAALIAGYFFVPYAKRHYIPVSVDMDEAAAMEKADMGERKVLTVYFTRVGNSEFEEDVDAVSSASLMKDNETLVGNSQLLATMVYNAVGGELYGIQTEKKYPSAYSDTVSVAKDEMDSDEDVALSGTLPELSRYDMVVLVFPVWWGTIPGAVKSFLQSDDLSGKTIYPLVTHGGSGAGNSVEDIRKLCKADVSNDVLEVFDDDVANAAGAVSEWLKSLH
jgi:Putative NADPH-quinone reductase (modulator of drug activity B)